MFQSCPLFRGFIGALSSWYHEYGTVPCSVKGIFRMLYINHHNAFSIGFIPVIMVVLCVVVILHLSPADLEFVKTFLFTYQAFTTPEKLLRKLIERYNVVCPEGMPLKQFDVMRQTIQARVINALRLWVDLSVDFKGIYIRWLLVPLEQDPLNTVHLSVRDTWFCSINTVLHITSE